MKVIGNLRKMKTEDGNPIQYQLTFKDESYPINPAIGQTLTMHFTGEINCVKCGNLTKKSFGQGFCYPCFISAPEMSECIIRPELCEGHLGKGRDPEWETKHHVQPHIVYLALSSGVKVGVTREDQIPTRWIDQGASEAIILAETNNRQEAGKIEVALKAHMSDKTQWQRMLKNQILEGVDLIEEKETALDLLPEEYEDFFSEDYDVWQAEYPVLEYPEKVKSINLDKTPSYTGKLMGIKGQYLIFEENLVINLRKYGGYKVEFEW